MKTYNWKTIHKEHYEALLNAERFAETSRDMEIVDLEELFRDRETTDTGVFGVCHENLNGGSYFMPDWCLMRNFAGECSFHKSIEDAHKHFQKNALENLTHVNLYAPKNSELKKWTQRFINRLSKNIKEDKITDEMTWNRYTYTEK